jgi:superfamily II DNA or RNA helicase
MTLARPSLRDYQGELKIDISQLIVQNKKAGTLAGLSILVQCATGGGKTMTAADIMAGAEAKGNRVVFMVPRRELVYQTVEKLAQFGVVAGIIMAGEPLNWHRKIQVASYDTLHSRAMKRQRIELPQADIVIIDEAHLSVAKTKLAIIREYRKRGSIVIGLTATPARGDGKPLKAGYDHLILGWPTAKMIEHAYLVPVRYIAPDTPDLAGIRVGRSGDYDENELAERLDKPKLVGDIVENWLLHAADRSTVVFCITKKHGRHVCEEFNRRGIKAEHVDDDTPDDERRDIFERVRSGVTQVLTNVFVASYGLDIPRLSCAVLARPTKSLVLYLQIVGRVLRPVFAPGMPLDTIAERLAAFLKPDAMVIDHSGAVDEHGFVDDPIPWTLEGNERIETEKKRVEQEREAPKEITCYACKYVFKGSRTCPQCGHQMIPPGEPVPVYKAVLKEIGRDAEGKRANKTTPWPEKASFYAQALGYAREKGFKDGWAANKYKAKFGVWPNDVRVRNVQPEPPGKLIKGYIQFEAIQRNRARA